MTAATALAKNALTNVDAPLAQPPLDTLITVSNVIPEAGERWMNGLAVRYPVAGTCAPEVRAEPCFYDVTAGGGALADKLDASGYAGATSDASAPFLVYLPVRCTRRGIVNDPEFRQRAEAQFTAMEHYGVERVFWSGVAGTAIPFLKEAAWLTGPGAATSPVRALIALENAIAAMARRGVIHTTPGVATAWASLNLLERGSDGKLRTRLGTLVLPGQGYTSGTNDADAYATGQIDLRRSDVFIPSSEAESLDRLHNDLVYRVERYYSIVPDRACGVTAVAVDLSTI